MTELAERANRFRKEALWLAVVPVALASVDLIGSTFAVQAFFPFLLAFLFCAIGVFAWPIALYRAWRLGPARREAMLGLAVLLSVTVIAFASMVAFSWPLRKLAFARTAERAAPLVVAIEAFERAEGRPPEALTELIPAYLPAVPGTGLVAYPKFEYERFSYPGTSVLWWDLGSRRGAPITGLWVYPDGDPKHAIVALELDAREVVVEARMDRMPSSTEGRPFSSDSWRTDIDQRLHMVHDLAQKYDLRGKGRLAIEELLGPPSGRRVVRDSPWELRIPCPLGPGNWDVFFFWPSERYPKYLYGGSTERIGRWAYVHE
jgi:hypothetical protein